MNLDPAASMPYIDNSIDNPYSDFRVIARTSAFQGEPDVLLGYLKLEVMERLLKTRPEQYGKMDLDDFRTAALQYLEADRSLTTEQGRAVSLNALAVLDPVQGWILSNRNEMNLAADRYGMFELTKLLDRLAKMSPEDEEKYLKDMKTVVDGYFAAGNLKTYDAETQQRLYDQIALDSSLRSMVAYLRTVGSFGQVGIPKVSDFIKDLAKHTGKTAKFAVTALLLSSVVVNSWNKNEKISTDAAGISRLVGESFYMLGLGHAFNDIMPNLPGSNSALMRRVLPQGMMDFLTPEFFQKPFVKAAAETAANTISLGQGLRDSVDDLIANYSTTKLNDIMAPLSGARPDTPEGQLYSKLAEARRTSVAKFGGGILSLGDIAIGIGQIVDGSKRTDTLQGRVTVAGGAMSVTAGVLGLASLLAGPAAPYVAAAAALFTIISAVLGIFSMPKRPDPHPIYGLTDHFEFNP